MTQQGRSNPLPISRRLIWIMGALTGLGLASFLAGLLWNPARAWQIYLVNFLFWSGLAQGGVVFAAIYHVVGAKWGPLVQRLAEGMTTFLPVSLVLFLPLFFGLDRFLGQINELNPQRGVWFDPRFVFVRGGLGLGSMTVLSLLFVYYSLRPDIGVALNRGEKSRRLLYTWLTEGWQENSAEIQHCRRGKDVLAAGVLLAYPIIYTFMAFDLIMALDPFWYSSLFGGYFFISTFYLGLAGIVMVSVLCRQCLGIQALTLDHFWDLGKLLLSFNLIYVALLWTQYIVIWYGNLPEETHFLVLRIWEKPWTLLSWSSLAAASIIPFLVLLSRRAKQMPWVMFSVSILIVTGLWLERYILVVPSLWHLEWAPFGWIEIGVTVGFFGALGMSTLFFLQNFLLLPLVGEQPIAASGEDNVEVSPSRA